MNEREKKGKIWKIWRSKFEARPPEMAPRQQNCLPRNQVKSRRYDQKLPWNC